MCSVDPSLGSALGSRSAVVIIDKDKEFGLFSSARRVVCLCEVQDLLQ